MHIGDKLVQCRFLAVVALENQMHAFERHAVGRDSAIVSDIRQRMHSATERYSLTLIDRIDDSRGGRQFLGHRCRAEKVCTDQYTKGKRTQIGHGALLTLPSGRTPNYLGIAVPIENAAVVPGVNRDIGVDCGPTDIHL